MPTEGRVQAQDIPSFTIVNESVRSSMLTIGEHHNAILDYFYANNPLPDSLTRLTIDNARNTVEAIKEYALAAGLDSSDVEEECGQSAVESQVTLSLTVMAFPEEYSHRLDVLCLSVLTEAQE
jgi:hypothetical protein